MNILDAIYLIELGLDEAVVSGALLLTERKTRPINIIAQEIQGEWNNVSQKARPYLQIMSSIDSVTDVISHGDGREIVSQFLANSQDWKGGVADKLKSELVAAVSADKKGLGILKKVLLSALVAGVLLVPDVGNVVSKLVLNREGTLASTVYAGSRASSNIGRNIDKIRQSLDDVQDMVWKAGRVKKFGDKLSGKKPSYEAPMSKSVKPYRPPKADYSGGQIQRNR